MLNCFNCRNPRKTDNERDAQHSWRTNLFSCLSITTTVILASILSTPPFPTVWWGLGVLSFNWTKRRRRMDEVRNFLRMSHMLIMRRVAHESLTRVAARSYVLNLNVLKYQSGALLVGRTIDRDPCDIYTETNFVNSNNHSQPRIDAFQHDTWIFSARYKVWLWERKMWAGSNIQRMICIECRKDWHEMIAMSLKRFTKWSAQNK